MVITIINSECMTFRQSLNGAGGGQSLTDKSEDQKDGSRSQILYLSES
jgi:hypothetical protein